MDTLSYIRLAQTRQQLKRADFDREITLQIITNFTDDIPAKILSGMCLSNGIYPTIFSAPYKQYHQKLKGFDNGPKVKADVTFICFDVNAYVHSEFKASPEHYKEVVEDLARFSEQSGGQVVVSTLIPPTWTAYGGLYPEDGLYKLVQDVNNSLEELARKKRNIHLVSMDRLMRYVGEGRARDLRNLYAFDVPFTADFFLELVKEWYALVQAFAGRARKCLVLDLDNTLWGGVVGERGPHDIDIGPGYPGYAFQNFQRAIITLSDRGVILAINSRNNPGDVDEVFEKNKNMLLTKDHFASIYTNWSTKADNLISIAKDLNIGLDSLVFLDDDAVNRDHVRTVLPEVVVPELPPEPEKYIEVLFSLRDFHQSSLTEEDKKKSKLYAQERKRGDLKATVKDLDEYVAGLDIHIQVAKNDTSILPRLSQLTLKTNQFNVTTKRYTEDDIQKKIDEGVLVYSGAVHDKFGEYGVVAEAIVENASKKTAAIDTFLMSCRVMGRHVEYSFIDYLIRDLHIQGVVTIKATFIPTKKNIPSENFFSNVGFKKVKTKKETELVEYSLKTDAYVQSEFAQKVLKNGIVIE